MPFLCLQRCSSQSCVKTPIITRSNNTNNATNKKVVIAHFCRGVRPKTYLCVQLKALGLHPFITRILQVSTYEWESEINYSRLQSSKVFANKRCILFHRFTETLTSLGKLDVEREARDNFPWKAWNFKLGRFCDRKTICALNNNRIVYQASLFFANSSIDHKSNMSKIHRTVDPANPSWVSVGDTYSRKHFILKQMTGTPKALCLRITQNDLVVIFSLIRMACLPMIMPGNFLDPQDISSFFNHIGYVMFIAVWYGFLKY